MMFYRYGGWGGPFFGPSLWWWLVPLTVWLLFMFLFRGRWGWGMGMGGCGHGFGGHGDHAGHDHGSQSGGSSKDALEILKERYARGEITTEEYRQMREELQK